MAKESLPVSNTSNKLCSVPGCSSRLLARQMCVMHYGRFMRNGTVESRIGGKSCSIDGCDRKYYGQGYCGRHYWRWHANGHPLATRIPTPDNELFSWALFWSGVDITADPNECWIWARSCVTRGYGSCVVYFKGKKILRSHRAAYTLHHKVEIGELHVLHSCDNPPCCNPNHLRLGTHAENMADRRIKGRKRKQETIDMVKAAVEGKAITK